LKIKLLRLYLNADTV